MIKDKKDLKGHLAIVTGAAGGIGFSFALELARRNCSLILIDINSDGLRNAENLIRKNLNVSALSISINLFPIDLTSQELTEPLDSFLLMNNLEPDILINNAGIFSFKPVTDHTERRIELFIDLHVRAVTVLSRWFARRREKIGSGYILNMSSMSCWMPMPGIALYSSTKAYIRVFTRALHYELKDSGINVTVACPGGIATDLFGLPENLKKLAVRLKVLDTPEKFASKAINGMIRGKKQYINGWINRFSIFFIGVMPTWVRMLVKRKLLDKGITR